MKKIVGMLAALGVAAAMPLTAWASAWQQTSGRWWYQMDGGKYPVNGWMWIDGDRNGIAECYYFDQAGYLLTNTVTPDNCRVNQSGAWVDGNGTVHTKRVPIVQERQQKYRSRAAGSAAPRQCGTAEARTRRTHGKSAARGHCKSARVGNRRTV